MPKYTDKFEEIDKSKIGEMAKSKKDTSARFINLHATTLGEDLFQLTYSFTTDGILTENYSVKVTSADAVPSISDTFMTAFFFENEIHDLFGINIEGIILDYKGDFYQVALDRPMARPSTDEDMYSVNRKNDANTPVKDVDAVEKGGDE